MKLCCLPVLDFSAEFNITSKVCISSLRLLTQYLLGSLQIRLLDTTENPLGAAQVYDIENIL